MPRRIPDYALQFADFNRWSTVGSFLVVGAQLVFFCMVFQTVRGGRKAEARSWGRGRRSGVDRAITGVLSHLRYTTARAVARFF